MKKTISVFAAIAFIFIASSSTASAYVERDFRSQPAPVIIGQVIPMDGAPRESLPARKVLYGNTFVYDLANRINKEDVTTLFNILTRAHILY